MYASYFCLECEKPFAKVGALVTNKKGKVINPVICPHCESENVITHAEFLEKEKVKEESEEKKNNSKEPE